MLHEVADPSPVSRRQAFIRGDGAVDVPGKEAQVGVHHQAMVVRSIFFATLRVQIDDRQLARVVRATERAAWWRGIVEDEPALLTGAVVAGLYQVDGAYQRRLPLVRAGPHRRVVQSVNEGSVEKHLEVGAGGGVGEAVGVHPGQFRGSCPIDAEAVGAIHRVLDEHGLFPHGQPLVLDRVLGVDLLSPQRVTQQQQAIDHHGQRVAIGADAGQHAARVIPRQAAAHHDLWRDEVGCADHLRWKPSGDHQAIDIDDADPAAGGGQQHVLVAEVGVGEARCVQASQSACQFQAELQVAKPVAALSGIQKLELMVRRGKPFALLVLASNLEHVVVERTMLEEKVVVVERRHDTDAPAMLDRCGGPAEQLFPVVPGLAFEYPLAVGAGDHVEPLDGMHVRCLAVEGHDIVPFRACVDILHAATGDDSVTELDRLAVGGRQRGDGISHAVPHRRLMPLRRW